MADDLILVRRRQQFLRIWLFKNALFDVKKRRLMNTFIGFVVSGGRRNCLDLKTVIDNLPDRDDDFYFRGERRMVAVEVPPWKQAKVAVRQ